MHVKLETITPSMAKRWLAVPLPPGINQRTVSQPSVNSLVETGILCTGDTIKIGIGGYVLDGQHRLLACIQIGKPFESAVAYDVPDDVFDVLDDVRPRSAGDKAKMAGVINANGVVAVASILAALREAADGIDTSVSSARSRVKRTYLSLKPMIEEWGTDIQWALASYPSKIEPGIPSGGAPVRAALVYARMCGSVQQELNPFIKDVVFGAERNTPAWALRNAIARASASASSRVSLSLQALRAIELASQGKPCGLLRDSPEILSRMTPVPKPQVLRRSAAR